MMRARSKKEAPPPGDALQPTRQASEMIAGHTNMAN
jgi:hypothetical protein